MDSTLDSPLSLLSPTRNSVVRFGHGNNTIPSSVSLHVSPGPSDFRRILFGDGNCTVVSNRWYAPSLTSFQTMVVFSGPFPIRRARNGNATSCPSAIPKLGLIIEGMGCTGYCWLDRMESSRCRAIAISASISLPSDAFACAAIHCCSAFRTPSSKSWGNKPTRFSACPDVLSTSSSSLS